MTQQMDGGRIAAMTDVDGLQININGLGEWKKISIDENFLNDRILQK